MRAARSAQAVPAAAKAGSNYDSCGTTEVVPFHVPSHNLIYERVRPGDAASRVSTNRRLRSV